MGVIIKKNGKYSVLYGYASTDINGFFSIDSAEVGNYSIIMDYPGIPMYNDWYATNFSITSPNDTTISLLGKVDSAYIRLYPYVGIENLSRENPDMKLYPNPSSGKFTLSIKNANWNDACIQISDIQGRLVYSEKLPSNHGSEYIKPVDLSSKTTGIYFLRFINEKTSKAVLLMIEF